MNEPRFFPNNTVCQENVQLCTDAMQVWMMKGLGMRSVPGSRGSMGGGMLLPLTAHTAHTRSQEWIETTSQFIKTVDPNHMVAIGSEVLAARGSSTLSLLDSGAGTRRI